MAAALERVLGYGHITGAYYSPQVSRETKTLDIPGQRPFTCAMDLFDAERHVFPYPDASFDVVLCCELIEHLPSLTSVAAVLHGWLNPQIYPRYPAPGNPDIPHVREYTPRELRDAAAAAGFAVEALFTERMPNADEAGWVKELLEANGFDVSLRGEQMYCLARKRADAARERYPAFLYDR